MKKIRIVELVFLLMTILNNHLLLQNLMKHPRFETQTHNYCISSLSFLKFVLLKGGEFFYRCEILLFDLFPFMKLEIYYS